MTELTPLDRIRCNAAFVRVLYPFKFSGLSLWPHIIYVTHTHLLYTAAGSHLQSQDWVHEGLVPEENGISRNSTLLLPALEQRYTFMNILHVDRNLKKSWVKKECAQRIEKCLFLWYWWPYKNYLTSLALHFFEHYSKVIIITSQSATQSIIGWKKERGRLLAKFFVYGQVHRATDHNKAFAVRSRYECWNFLTLSFGLNAVSNSSWDTPACNTEHQRDTAVHSENHTVKQNTQP